MIGRTLSHYVIRRQLGAGGMGVVYEAEDLRLGRRVALKLLPEDSPKSKDHAERLFQEARAASSLNHPNICTIYEIDEAEGHPFIAMELLEGQPLLGSLTGAPFTVERVLDLALQMASALEAAHGKGVIHRDIKPANIFVTASGQVKILDFGLAKLTHTHALAKTAGPMTTTGTVVGTVAYMSPEQARGDDLDARSDLFSLGVVLYQIASGRLPFAGKTSAVIFHEILAGSPAPLLKENSELPPKLAEAIERLLEKDPELRYQSAADLRSDLRRMRRELEGSLDVPARPSGVVKRAREKKTSVRTIAALLAVVAAIAAGVGVYALKFRRAALPFANYEMKKLTQSGDVEMAALSPDGRYLLSVKAGHGEESLWLRNIPTNADAQVIPPSAERYRSLQFSPDGDYIFFVRDAGPGVQDLFRAPVLGGTPKRLVHDVESNVSFSPDGASMAFVRRHASPQSAETAQYDVVIAGVNGEGERTLHTHDVALWEGVSWSPTEGASTLASTAMVTKSSLGKILVIDAETGAEKELFASDRLSANDCLWLPDGRGLLVLYKDKETGFSKGQIGYVRYPQGDFTPITRDTDDYSSLSLSADGRQLATVEHLSNFDLEIAEMIGNRPVSAKVVGSHELAKYVSWTPSGDLLLDQGSKLVSADAGGAGRKTLLDDPLHRYVTGAISCSEGKYVVFTSIDQAANRSNVWRMGKDGGDLKQLTDGIDDFAQFCSRDGKWVYYLDETTNGIRRVPIEGGKSENLAGPRENSIASASPDGLYFARFAFVGGKEKLMVANAETGDVVRSFDHDPRLASFAQAPRFTPDGRAIAYVIRDDGTDNLYAQPLDSSKGETLTQFSGGHIRDFAWSPDGKQLAMIRGHYDSDVVLLRSVLK